MEKSETPAIYIPSLLKIGLCDGRFVVVGREDYEEMAYDIGDCIVDDDLESIALMIFAPDGRVLKTGDGCSDIEAVQRFLEWDHATSSLFDFSNLLGAPKGEEK